MAGRFSGPHLYPPGRPRPQGGGARSAPWSGRFGPTLVVQTPVGGVRVVLFPGPEAGGTGTADRLRSCPARTRDGSEMAGEPEKTERSGDEPGQDAERKSPVLTERQRQEARRQRQARRRQARRPRPGNALSRGIRATGHEIVRTARFVARGIAAAFEATGPVGRHLRAGVARLGSAARAGAGFLAAGVAGLFRGAARSLARADRVITPRRALIVAAGLAVALLFVSQFTEFRATAIGEPGYAGIEDVTGAPRVDVRTPIGAHSVLLLAAGILALAGLAGSIRTGRRRSALLLLAAGAVSLAVSLAVDLPNGLDAGEAELSYSGAESLLLSGFWLELAAGVTLAWTGALLPLNSTPGNLPRRTAPRNGGAA